MNKSLVITVVGADRPGLVESVSQAVASHDGNWLKSRMTTLAGQFAGLLWVMVPVARMEALEAALAALESEGLRVVIQDAESTTPEPERIVEVELMSHDRPGVVREVARALTRRGVNVEELSTESYSAPMTGEPLFKAKLELGLGADMDVDAVREALESLAEQLGLDLTFGEVQVG